MQPAPALSASAGLSAQDADGVSTATGRRSDITGRPFDAEALVPEVPRAPDQPPPSAFWGQGSSASAAEPAHDAAAPAPRREVPEPPDFWQPSATDPWGILSEVVERFRLELAANCGNLVACVESRDGPRGWTVTLYVRPELLKAHRDQLVAIAQETLLCVAHRARRVVVLGFASRPFSPMPLGFGAAIADLPEGPGACWTSFSMGFCESPSTCQRLHPKHQVGINVMLKPARSPHGRRRRGKHGPRQGVRRPMAGATSARAQPELDPSRGARSEPQRSECLYEKPRRRPAPSGRRRPAAAAACPERRRGFSSWRGGRAEETLRWPSRPRRAAPQRGGLLRAGLRHLGESCGHGSSRGKGAL